MTCTDIAGLTPELPIDLVSALAGIALDRRDISSLDTPIGDIVPETVAHLSAEQQGITLRHRLTMTGGFRWNESGGHGDYNGWIISGDHLGFLLARPTVATPGTCAGGRACREVV